MTFNTGNNVPSTDPRDLYDNAENLDKLVNGADPFYADRKGVLRQSYAGMENDFDTAQEGRETAFTLSQADKESRFQSFLESSGYIDIGPYAAGIEFTARNQYVAVDGQFYRPAAATAIPYTTTGDWATESGNFVLLGDDVLRQELGASGGAGVVGFRPDAAYPPDTIGDAVAGLINDRRSPAYYGAVGDGVTDDKTALQAWQDACHAEGMVAFLPARQFYCAGNLVLKADTLGVGKALSQIIFAHGYGPKTFVGASSFYGVNLHSLGFVSDKSQYWNATDAGEAYDPAVTRADVKRLYGARVFKGNKTTTPNNICALDPAEKAAGTGFWNKFYAQWMQADGAIVDVSLAGDTSYTDDAFVYRGGGGRMKEIVSCLFQGFSQVVFCGTYMLEVRSCDFVAMRKVLTIDASHVGGPSGARITSLNFKANLFEDVWVGIYAHTLLQSVVNSSNVFQPVICGVYVGTGGAAGTVIDQNYFEICHTCVYYHPNLNAFGGGLGLNFSNESYSRYLLWMNSGSGVNVRQISGGQKIRVAAGVAGSSFPKMTGLVIDAPYFTNNGNAVGSAAKSTIYKLTGVAGTSATVVTESGSVSVNGGTGFLAPTLTHQASGQGNGIKLPSNIHVHRVEILNVASDFMEPWSAETNPENYNIFYFSTLTAGNLSAYDFRVAGLESRVRLIWSEV